MKHTFTITIQEMIINNWRKKTEKFEVDSIIVDTKFKETFQRTIENIFNLKTSKIIIKENVVTNTITFDLETSKKIDQTLLYKLDVFEGIDTLLTIENNVEKKFNIHLKCNII